jgi:hypothetical protein
MWGIGKASRRPRRFARATEGGFPRLSDSVPHGLWCPTPLRHALLAESLGKPSLWVITNEIWYKTVARPDLSLRPSVTSLKLHKRWSHKTSTKPSSHLNTLHLSN